LIIRNRFTYVEGFNKAKTSEKNLLFNANDLVYVQEMVTMYTVNKNFGFELPK
jgi:hypothetical protein